MYVWMLVCCCCLCWDVAGGGGGVSWLVGTPWRSGLETTHTHKRPPPPKKHRWTSRRRACGTATRGTSSSTTPRTLKGSSRASRRRRRVWWGYPPCPRGRTGGSSVRSRIWPPLPSRTRRRACGRWVMGSQSQKSVWCAFVFNNAYPTHTLTHTYTDLPPQRRAALTGRAGDCDRVQLR